MSIVPNITQSYNLAVPVNFASSNSGRVFINVPFDVKVLHCRQITGVMTTSKNVIITSDVVDGETLGCSYLTTASAGGGETDIPFIFNTPRKIQGSYVFYLFDFAGSAHAMTGDVVFLLSFFA